MCLTPNGRDLFVSVRDGRVLHIDPAAMKQRASITVNGTPCDVQASDAGGVFVSAGTQIAVVDMKQGREVARWDGIREGNRIRLAPDQARLYVGNWASSPASVSAYRIPPVLADSNGRRIAECSVDANFAVRGEIFVSPDGRTLFAEAGRVFSLAQ
jgi:hypothetical protein